MTAELTMQALPMIKPTLFYYPTTDFARFDNQAFETLNRYEAALCR